MKINRTKIAMIQAQEVPIGATYSHPSCESVYMRIEPGHFISKEKCTNSIYCVNLDTGLLAHTCKTSQIVLVNAEVNITNG